MSTSSSLLLRGSSLGLGRLLLVAVDHHDSDERANHGRAQESQKHGDADCPYARKEEGMERVARVDEWLV